jgi:hypothetical protein
MCSSSLLRKSHIAQGGEQENVTKDTNVGKEAEVADVVLRTMDEE